MAPPRIGRKDVEFSAVRSQGPGGQNVNKVSTAAQLRYDIHRSSLPDDVRQRLLALPDQRIGADGVVVVKAQGHRSLARNQSDALHRLQALVDSVAEPPAERRPTKPTRASKLRRLEGKAQRAQVKVGRRSVTGE